MNTGIRFFDSEAETPDHYTFVIIVCRHRDQWVWVRHKERKTWELPAGHIEQGEELKSAAERELFEETGAMDYSIWEVTAYEGILNGTSVFGMIYYAEIRSFGPLPEYEIAEVRLFPALPESLTYPDIQPAFFNYAAERKQ